MNSSGTDEYITRIVTTYSQTLYRVAYTALRCQADAQDIVQEVFLRLMKKRPVFSDSEHEKAWLIRVTVNLAKNRLKSHARRTVSFDECRELEQHREEPELLGAVLAMEEKYSTVIHLYYYEGYSISEIAKILNIPSATVGTRLYRGRHILRSMLEGGNYDG